MPILHSLPIFFSGATYLFYVFILMFFFALIFALLRR